MSHTHHEPIRRDAPYQGHAHVWQRALARREFMRVAAGTAGLALGSRLWMPLLAQAAPSSSSIAPKPIPGGGQPFGPGTEVFHNYAPPVDPQIGGLPWPELDLSQITDFKGAMAVARIQGTGTLTQGAVITQGALYDADMRFMQGRYVGVDGEEHQGTFGFF
jgi:hypothetical protein